MHKCRLLISASPHIIILVLVVVFIYLLFYLFCFLFCKINREENHILVTNFYLWFVYVFVMDQQSFMEDHCKGYVKKYFGENLSAQEAWWRVGGELLLLCTCVVIFFPVS